MTGWALGTGSAAGARALPPPGTNHRLRAAHAYVTVSESGATRGRRWVGRLAGGVGLRQPSPTLRCRLRRRLRLRRLRRLRLRRLRLRRLRRRIVTAPAVWPPELLRFRRPSQTETVVKLGRVRSLV